MMSNKRNSEIIIVGGGPAGLAAALALTQKGARCTVVDHAKPPVDKACGEGLMPDSRLALARLGVSITEQGNGVFTGIKFNRGKLSVEASFPHGSGVGVRRTLLHDKLISQAEKVGVNLMWNSRIKLLENEKVVINNEPIDYEWLIGADGLNSAVRKWASFDAEEKVCYRYGARRHYRVNLWTERMEIYWADCGQMYITPVGATEICVIFLSRSLDVRFDQAMSQFPLLIERLAKAVPIDNLKGAATATRQLKIVAKGRIALVGDAAGSVDAITGEGLALSFRQSIALADAIECGDISSYCRKQKELALLPTRMANLMLLLDRYPNLQEKALDALSRTPETFGKLLASHVGHKSLPLTLATEVPKFAWSFLLSSVGSPNEIPAI
ncbi:MAG: NAD(P)/FAD-dependent oxidoreductase [Candidatus Obscuribacterales bacterium]|nr:NAD(P)/FAD-dependent oxidoreductase [Candidatus Obscuribacterales bacterium]